jgi:hypothetical protein
MMVARMLNDLRFSVDGLRGAQWRFGLFVADLLQPANDLTLERKTSDSLNDPSLP